MRKKRQIKQVQIFKIINWLAIMMLCIIFKDLNLKSKKLLNFMRPFYNYRKLVGGGGVDSNDSGGEGDRGDVMLYYWYR